MGKVLEHYGVYRILWCKVCQVISDMIYFTSVINVPQHPLCLFFLLHPVQGESLKLRSTQLMSAVS